jgi:ADP-ribose pyrophosphatase
MSDYNYNKNENIIGSDADDADNANKEDINNLDSFVEKEISSKQIFEGKILKVFLDNVMLPNKKIASREKVLHPGAVGVVPVTEEKNIILIKQYRYPVKDILTEIPAGKLDKDEIPINCARRELKEEIGAFGGNFIHLSSFYTTPGFSNEFLHLYLAVNFKLMKNNPEEDEFLQAVEIPLDDGVKWVYEGKIRDAKSIIGILLANTYIKNNYLL